MYLLALRPKRDPFVQRLGVQTDYLRVVAIEFERPQDAAGGPGSVDEPLLQMLDERRAVLRRDATTAAVVHIAPAAQAQRRSLGKLERPDFQPHGDLQRRLTRRFGQHRPGIVARRHVRHVPRHPDLPDQSRQHRHGPAIAGAASFGQRGGHRHALRRVGPLNFVHAHVRRQRGLRQISEAQPDRQRLVRAVGQIQRAGAVLAPHGVDGDRLGRLSRGHGDRRQRIPQHGNTCRQRRQFEAFPKFRLDAEHRGVLAIERQHRGERRICHERLG